MRNCLRTGAVLVLALLVGGCGSAPTSLADLNTSYERALARTAPLAVTLPPGTELERQAFGNLQRYFSGMTAASVAELTPVVYAPSIWALIMMVIRLLPRAVMRRVKF